MAAMTGKVFIEKLNELMAAALQGPEMPPLPQIIYELEMAKMRCINHRLGFEMQVEQQKLAQKIIPAGSSLPVHFPADLAGGN